MMIMHYAKINWAQRECGDELSVMLVYLCGVQMLADGSFAESDE